MIWSLNTSLKEVKVYVEYQVCKEQCIQQDKTFTFKLPAIKATEKVDEIANEEINNEKVSMPIVPKSAPTKPRPPSKNPKALP